MTRKDAAFYLLCAATILVCGWIGTGRQANAQEPPRQAVESTEPAETIEDLYEIIERKNDRIERGKEWNRTLQSKVYARNRTIATLKHQLREADTPSLAALDELWEAGYLGAGGKHLDEFEQVILPCESGGFPEQEHTIVGPTDDWGRAQVNRPVWKPRFEQKFGVDYETHVTNPVLNGAMAAVVEQEHHGATGPGLEAWTCWRNRNR